MALPSTKMEIRGQHIAPVFLNKTIPRFQILGGSRLNPEMAIEALKLTNVKREDIVRGKRVGRVSVVTGDYHFRRHGEKGTIRLVAGETEMAFGADDITTREYAYSAEDEPVVQVRRGTAGGMNTRNLDAPEMKLGDIVIADRSIGSSGAIFQSMGYFPKVVIDMEAIGEAQRFVAEWQKLGGTVTADGRFLVMKNDPIVVQALCEAAGKLRFDYHVGGAFSKESLYGEGSEELMLALREKEGVLATEMEQLQNAYIAAVMRAKHDVRILTGMVVAVIGAVPGAGFPDRNDKQQMKLQEKTEENALKIAAEAMVSIAKNLGLA